MAVRTPHGRVAELSLAPRVEVLPPDELPLGVQAEQQAPSTSERKPGGMWAKGASTDQRKGGQSRAGSTRLARRMGLAGIESDPTFVPYKRAATDFRPPR
jgi:hypothetical protein